MAQWNMIREDLRKSDNAAFYFLCFVFKIKAKSIWAQSNGSNQAVESNLAT
jgi:hypothetical protein